MRHDILRPCLIAASVPALLAATAAPAQTSYPQPAPAAGFSDADQLAQQMRTLAANPRNLDALIRAGQLALRLDDATAASGFFARAEHIDPRNPRIKAGQASILVAEERPGEALRKFAEAEALGIDPHAIAADRGLAYDLIGEQRRAQIEYKTAAQFDPSDENTRRYALSLGISGKKDEAEKLLDPLLRRNDRGAWRARAFVLAMTGDQRGAEQIAATMMPPGMAQGLQIFFDRLPGFGPVDRAFAVHFGEVRASPARLADARLVPILPALAPEPAPVQVAAVQPPPAPAKNDRRDRRRKGTALAAAVVAPPTPTPSPLPPPPSYMASIATPMVQPLPYSATRPRVTVPSNAMVQPLPGVTSARTATVQPLPHTGSTSAPSAATVQPLPALPTARANIASATVQPLPQRTMTAVPVRQAPVVAAAPAASMPSRSSGAALAAITPPAAAVTQADAPGVKNSAVAKQPVVTATGAAAADRPPVIAAATTRPAPSPGFSSAAAPTVTSAPQPSVAPAPVSLASILGAAPASGAAPSGGSTSAGSTIANEAHVTAVTAPAGTPPAGSEAAIVSTLSSGNAAPARAVVAEPSAPVAVTPVPSAVETTPLPKPPVVAAANPEPAAPVVRRESLKALLTAPPLAARSTRAGSADKLAATAGKADADTAADTKTKKAEAKKLADKAAEKKAAEEKKRNDPKRLEPERIWVQVAGGANEETLSKAYGAVQGKAGALKGRAAWTTPLRATNRVLVGPFKTESEAQALVNKLGGQGVSAFTFTSEAGQKVSKLPGK